MSITSSENSLVNTTTLGGRQDGVQTAALANGGYVIAWTTDIGGQKDVMFQRYDADGNATGDAVLANAVTAGDQVLRDIVVTGNGDITLAWTTGKTVTTRTFDGDTGVPESAETSIGARGPTANGAQLISVGDSQYKIVMTSNFGGVTVMEQVTLNTDGSIAVAKTQFSASLAPSLSVVDLVDGNVPGTHFAMLSNGTVVSTADGSSIASTATEIMKLQDGVHVLADENLMNAMLSGLIGTGSALTTYSVAAGASAEAVISDLAVGADTYARELVNLGGGRILVAWVADTGTNFNDGSDPARITDPDGIYAAVYNTAIGGFEDEGLLVKDLGQGDAAAIANLQSITLEASIMADGRVALSWSQLNGFTGFDVFNTIIDARDGRFYGTAADNTLKGTEFDDTAYGFDGNDRLVGQKGNDKLYGGLGNDSLSGGAGDDTLYGDDGDDVMHGNDGSDILKGGAGNDFMAGHDGDDTLLGGDGNDSINGADGDDIIDAGAGNDVIQGGNGYNIIDGGSGIDVLSFAKVGSTFIDLSYTYDVVGNIDGFTPEDDLIVNVENVIGSDGSDYLAGNAGANVLRGGGGSDMILGRAGADRLFGGDGSDTFVYEFVSEGGDRIADYTIGEDQLMFVSENFGNVNAGNIATSLMSSSNGFASGTGPKFVLDNSGADAGNLWFDIDGGGAGARVLVATLVFTGDPVLNPFSAADFVFV